mgnify:CR=1 FL=1
MSEKRERPARAVKLNVINEPKDSILAENLHFALDVVTTKSQM